MKELLLKRALPFALTFAVGAAVGGFFQLFGRGWGGPRHTYSYGNRRGCGKKFRPNYFAPETKPPVILFKPDAFYQGAEGESHVANPVRVRVTFGADGVVQQVEPPLLPPAMTRAVERAARQIRFIPATSDGAPTTATEDVMIRLAPR
jgi:hypothetical protein